MESRKKEVGVLNDLLHVAKDGEHTFHQALSIAEDRELESALRVSMRSCMIAAQQLEEMIRDLGDEPSVRGSIPGAFRRAWMDVRTALSPVRRDALIEEIVRAERVAVGHYEDAMAMQLGKEVHDRVASQTLGARANLHRFENLAAWS